VPSALRTRGRSTGTLRPPRVTLPGWVPWRTAARSGLWRPLGPASRSTSASRRLCSTPIPVPTARASRPSRAAPASSASSIVTCSGRISSASAGRVGCVCLGRWRSPSGRAAWRLPDTYHTAGIRRGPPPQLLRSPGQPPGAERIVVPLSAGPLGGRGQPALDRRQPTGQPDTGSGPAEACRAWRSPAFPGGPCPGHRWVGGTTRPRARCRSPG
jgi:hypothetical protein